MDSSDDDDLFSYSNKQKLTFSSKIDFTDYNNSSSDDSEDDDSDVEEVAAKKPRTEVEDDAVGTPEPSTRSNPLLQRIAELNDIVSPPVIPICIQTTKRPTTRRTKKSEPVDISLLKKRFDDEDEDDYKLVGGDDDVLISSVPDCSLTITLKIRLHGAIEKYEVRKLDALSILIQKIASKENVMPSKISLSWHNSVLETTVSAKTLGLTIADILECYIHKEMADKENCLTVKVQSKEQTTEYFVHMDDKVELIFEKFCESHGGKIKNSKFSFDGEAITSSATYASLDMMDGDIIDAVLK